MQSIRCVLCARPHISLNPIYPVCVCVSPCVIHVMGKVYLLCVMPVRPCISVCMSLYFRIGVFMSFMASNGRLRWVGKRRLVLRTYRVLITTNSLEPASSLEGIILNPIT